MFYFEVESDMCNWKSSLTINSNCSAVRTTPVDDWLINLRLCLVDPKYKHFLKAYWQQDRNKRFFTKHSALQQSLHLNVALLWLHSFMTKATISNKTIFGEMCIYLDVISMHSCKNTMEKQLEVTSCTHTTEAYETAFNPAYGATLRKYLLFSLL